MLRQVKLLLLCLCAAVQCWAAVAGLLCEFRHGVALCPGDGIGRGVEDLFSEGKGTAWELCLYFGDMLQEAGYDVELRQGTMDFTAEQQEALPQTGLWPYLRVFAPVVPDCGSRDVGHSVEAYQFVDVFPAFNGMDTLQSNSVGLNEVSLLRLERNMKAGADDATLLELEEALGELAETLQYDFGHEEGIAGDRGKGTLAIRPVELRERGAWTSDERRAMLRIALEAGGENLLEYTLRQEEAIWKKLDLHWMLAETWKRLEVGEVLGQSLLLPALNLDNARVRQGNWGVPVGTEVTLRIERIVAEEVTDCLTLNSVAGDDLDFCVSCGSPTSRALNANIAALCSLLDRVDTVLDGLASRVTNRQLAAVAVADSIVLSDLENGKIMYVMRNVRFFEDKSQNVTGALLPLFARLASTEAFIEKTGGSVSNSALREFASAGKDKIHFSQGVKEELAVDLEIPACVLDGEREYQIIHCEDSDYVLCIPQGENAFFWHPGGMGPVVLSGAPSGTVQYDLGKTLSASLFLMDSLADRGKLGDFDYARLALACFGRDVDLSELESAQEEEPQTDEMKPACEIIYPEEEAFVQEGILDIIGSLRGAGDATRVQYRLELLDEYGNSLKLGDVSTDEELRYAVSPFMPDTETVEPVVKYGYAEEERVARLDMSALNNGKYTIVLQAGQLTCRRVFYLDSQLKCGQFSFSEEDFSVFAGRMRIKMSRAYSSANLYENGIGVGWVNSFDMMAPEIDECRAEFENLDGELLSLRESGTRDVTVTLTDGQRVTFRFSLEAGSAYSFAYYARWTAPAGVTATLTPSCSDKLVALSSMEPYWEAAGPGVPWERFDFPGFVLTEGNGRQYYIEREFLGNASIVDGEEYCNLDLYGDLRVDRRVEPDGYELKFGENVISGTFADGGVEEVMRISRDEKGRISCIKLLNGKNSEYAYSYDAIGNLVEVSRTIGAGTPEIVRTYVYGATGFPHLLTAVYSGTGTLLAKADYDGQGRLAALGNDGMNSLSLASDAFAGVEIQRNAMGQEVIIRHDVNGNVLSITEADGSETRYCYDRQGREIGVVNPMGDASFTEYDGNGNVTCHENECGERTNYWYSGDVCSQVCSSYGKRMQLTYAGDQVASISLQGGRQIGVEHNGIGKVSRLEDEALGVDMRIEYGRRGLEESICDASGTEINFDYDDDGRLRQVSNSLFHPVTGAEITYATTVGYDGEGRQNLVYVDEAHWFSCNYGSDGRLASAEMTGGDKVDYLYDVQGHLVQSSSADGTVKRYIYTLTGQLKYAFCGWQEGDLQERMTFAQGVEYCYDESGNVCSETRLKNAEVRLADIGHGSWECILLSSEAGQAKRAEYDKMGRKISESSYEGRQCSYGYDAVGRLVFVKNEYGDESRVEYGGDGLKKCSILPDGSKIAYGYDDAGLISSICLDNGRTWGYVHDEAGNLLELTLPDGSVEEYAYSSDKLLREAALPCGEGQEPATYRYEYDSVKALRQIEDPLGNRTSFENDEFGRINSETLPLGQVCRYEYDPDLQWPVAFEDFLHNRQEFSYDARGKIIEKRIVGDDKDLLYEYDYDHLGNLVSVLAGNENFSYAYDGENRLTSVSRNSVECQSFDYDLDGRCIAAREGELHKSFGYPAGQRTVQVAYARDGENLGNFEYRFDVCGRCSEIWRGDGGRRRLEYDVDGQLVLLQELSRQGTVQYEAKCQRDALGRLVVLEESRAGEQRRHAWEYDGMGRLISEGIDGKEQWHYAYDGAGNRTARWQDSYNGEYSEDEYTYDANDRLLAIKGKCSLRWDDNGRLLEILGEEALEFHWTLEGLLDSVTRGARTIKFKYGADGLLCGDELSEEGKILERREYFFAEDGMGGGSRLLWCKVWDGSGQLQRHRHYVWGAGLIAVLDMMTGEWQPAFVNVQGSLLGFGQASREYSAYGELLHGSEGATIGFCGEWQDEFTGLVYLRSRFYLPSLGIFISPDKAQRNIREPRDLNRYVYCRNDPVNRCDPCGTMSMMLAGIMFSASFMGVSGLAIDRSLQAANEYMLFTSAQLDAELFRKKHDNISLIVHGVWYHQPNYCDEFVKKLEKQTNNQDYYQFTWSGFSNFILPMTCPNKLQHNMAISSLSFVVCSMEAKAFKNLSVIAHSWGTVLSKDTLNCSIVPIHNWVTMGSPLPSDERKKQNGDNGGQGIFPNFPYNCWLNVAALNDPVIYFRMLGPGWGMLNAFSSYLWESSTPEQLCFISLEGSHCGYWKSPETIQAIVNKLNR